MQLSTNVPKHTSFERYFYRYLTIARRLRVTLPDRRGYPARPRGSNRARAIGRPSDRRSRHTQKSQTWMFRLARPGNKKSLYFLQSQSRASNAMQCGWLRAREKKSGANCGTFVLSSSFKCRLAIKAEGEELKRRPADADRRVGRKKSLN